MVSFSLKQIKPRKNRSHQPRSLTSLRWRKAWRDLTHDKGRTGLVILAMAVGIFAFSVIVGARDMVRRELNSSYQAIQPASATLYIDPFDSDFVESVRGMPQVARATGRRIVPVRVEVQPNVWQEIRLVTVDDFEALEVNIVFPQHGLWPPPDRQILIERNSLFLLQAEEGDEIRVQMPNSRIYTIPITGLVHDMNQLPAQVFGEGFAYVSSETLEWFGLPPNYDQLQIRVTGDTTNLQHIQQVTTSVEEKVEKSGRTIYRTDIPEPDTHYAADFLPTILLILGMLGTLALLLSSLLIINTLTALLKQQTRQIGVMKTLGATTLMIVTLYLRFVFILGFCALLLAVPLGAIGAYGLTRFVAWQLNFNVQNPYISWQIVIVEIGIGLLIPILAALYPVIITARVTIREALTDQGINRQQTNTSHLDTLLNHLPLSRPLRLSLRNTFRRKGRLILTLITLVLGGAIFISVMTLRTSLFATLEDTLKSRGYDIQVQLSRPYRTQHIEQEITQIQGVTAVESWRIVTGLPLDPYGFEGEPVIIHVLPHDTQFFSPNILSGRWLTQEDNKNIVIHNQLLDKEPHLHVGGPLTLKIGEREHTWQIVGITGDLRPPVGPTTAYMTQAAYTQTAGQGRYADSLQIATTNHDPDSHTYTLQAIEHHLDTTGIPVQATQTATEDRLIFTERFNIVTTLLTIMSLLIATVGSLGLTGTMTINVLERRREIGVMRAIGAANHHILRIFIVEGLVIGILSWIGAMILAQPMSRLMAYLLGQTFLGFNLTYVFSFGGALLWLLVVIILAVSASYWPAWQAAALRIREILAYE